MRPGIQMLVQDAAAGKFEEVVAEALDRISRDQEDIAAEFKRLSFAGIKINTLSEGEISQLHIFLKGTMNALFLKDSLKRPFARCAEGLKKAAHAVANAMAMTWLPEKNAANALSTKLMQRWSTHL